MMKLRIDRIMRILSSLLHFYLCIFIFFVIVPILNFSSRDLVTILLKYTALPKLVKQAALRLSISVSSVVDLKLAELIQCRFLPINQLSFHFDVIYKKVYALSYRKTKNKYLKADISTIDAPPRGVKKCARKH